MQLNKFGVPVNVPRDFKPNRIKRTVKVAEPRRSIYAENPYSTYGILTKIVNGLERTEIGPVGTKEYNQALKNGYTEVERFELPPHRRH